MIIYERQQNILHYLQSKEFATIKELADVIFSSESSVRRDIKELSQRGLVRQMHGGVTLSTNLNRVLPLCVRDNQNVTIKEGLAKEAATYVFDGATIFLDGSTTVRRIVSYLSHYKDLKIITNNLEIFTQSNLPNAEIYCTGGRFDSKSNIFIGSSAENYVKTIHADLLFFSSQGISANGEITDISEEETHLRRKMMEQAEKKIFLCDSDKIGIRKTFLLCTKEDVDHIVCNAPLPW